MLFDNILPTAELLSKLESILLKSDATLSTKFSNILKPWLSF